MTVIARDPAPAPFSEPPRVVFGRLAELAARGCDVAQQERVEHQIADVVAFVRLVGEVDGVDGPVPVAAIDRLLAAAANTERPLPQRVTVLAWLHQMLSSSSVSRGAARGSSPEREREASWTTAAKRY